MREPAFWHRPSSWISLLLMPLGALYGAVAAQRLTRKGLDAGIPVLCVGNYHVGGAGKTPAVLALTKMLRDLGETPVVLSRGYGGRLRGPIKVDPERHVAEEVGDEPLIIARRTACPTIVAKDRVAGARALVAAGADVVLADDGLQHLRLGRDCEIVVIDGARGFGNGRVLPAGPLREPLARVPRPDAVVMNGAPEHGSLSATSPALAALEMRLVAQEAVRLDGRETPRALQAFRGRRVHAVAGIGNPARFFRQLRAHGIEVIEHAFADHHRFAARELAFTDGLPVLMTEKDAVKCVAFANPRLWYVPVAAQFGAREAHELLARVLAKVRPTSVTGGQI